MDYLADAHEYYWKNDRDFYIRMRNSCICLYCDEYSNQAQKVRDTERVNAFYDKIKENNDD